MNPIMFPLVIVAAIILWFLLAAIFKPVGAILELLWNDVKKALKGNEKEKKEENIENE